ncbi:hypothetical protein BYT27DRAFT_7107484 [Phlegmacium glaucopus]|nr:hypothetical protein BYT27DRAFT_7107484 [Phlegmacium glaucopus]
MTSKSSQPLTPLWHELDDTYEEQLRVKRRRDEAGLYTAKRITGRQTSAKSKDDTIDIEDPDRPKSNINQKLRMNPIDQPDISDSDHDEPRYRPQARLHSRKTVRPQVSAKRSAARKINYVNTSSSEEDSDSDTSKGTSSSSSEKDQLDPDQYEVDMDEPPRPLRAPTPPEIMLLDRPPRITIPLPQIDPDLVNTPAAQSTKPPDELISALESLTLSTIRMQKTHQLPFLLRNVREGFLSRCRVLSVPIYSDNRQLSIRVQYNYLAGLTYKADISKWLCPLCELHGIFRTREMLDCHLRWDHAEVFSEWEQIDDTEESESWNLQLVIPEPEIQPKTEVEHTRYIFANTISTKLTFNKVQSHSIFSASQTPAASAVDRKTQLRSIPNTPTKGPEATPPRNPYSPFPYVSMSPTSARISTTSTSPSYRTPSTDVETKNIAKLDQFKTQDDSDYPSRSVSLSHRSTSQATSTTRSSTATRVSVSTTRTTTTVRSERPSRYPTPPPENDLLGPAARPPYLPAKSEYGGPTVYHSYRPGGPCLFDLLNTLPLDQFGVLDWEILDREEEIYESDDVKEEYKVMHALWARWIMLNRNKFIANYFKGMIAFVDEYWKIIHRAAGWDALRYWSLMLQSNHFLTGHEVAQVLVHYEGHTGMAFW